MKYSFQDLEISLERKPIKHLYLSISPVGEIRLRVPKHLSDGQIEAFLHSKMDWIQDKLKALPPVPVLRWAEGDLISFFGQDFPLRFTDQTLRMPIISQGTITMQRAEPDALASQMDKLYRTHLQARLDERVPYWANVMQVQPSEWRIKKMKTRWGSCNPRARRVWFSLELAKKDFELIDYVIVHELCHLLETGHNKRFYQLMTQYLPNWKNLKQRLNHRLDG